MAGFFEEPGALTAITAAIAVFSAILTIAWPYLVTDKLGARMKQVSSERERIRARERARLEEEKSKGSLKTEPKKVFRHIWHHVWQNFMSARGALVLEITERHLSVL